MCFEQENLTQIILLNLDNFDFVKSPRLDIVLITIYTCIENTISNSTCSPYMINTYFMLKIFNQELAIFQIVI